MTVGAITVTAQATSSPDRHDTQGSGGLLPGHHWGHPSGHQWGPTAGHQWGLSHGHGHATGFPLAVHAFEGDKGETKTILPVIKAFKKAHQLTDVTVVADAAMISESNQKAIYAAGLSFILGTRIPFLPSVVGEWRAKHPGEEIPDGHIFTQPWPASSSEKAPRDPREQ